MTDNKLIKKMNIAGFIFTITVGALLHFAFEFSGGNTLIGAFTPVNESVWEHLKLIMFPIILFSFIEYFAYGRENENFFAVKIYSAFLGMILIATTHYTITGITGTHYLALDIAIFIFSAAIAYYFAYKMIIAKRFLNKEISNIIAIGILAIVIILFIYFTFNPPQIELFRDPLTEDFGII